LKLLQRKVGQCSHGICTVGELGSCMGMGWKIYLGSCWNWSTSTGSRTWSL